jgi:hypothetical protein
VAARALELKEQAEREAAQAAEAHARAIKAAEEALRQYISALGVAQPAVITSLEEEHRRREAILALIEEELAQRRQILDTFHEGLAAIKADQDQRANDAAEAERIYKETAQAIAGAFLSVWDEINEDGIGAFDDLAGEIVKIMAIAGKEISDDMGLALAGIGGLGIGASSGSALTGIFGGAATGFGASGGNPIGALVGAAAGFVGSLLGSADDAREAARQMRIAREEFTAELELLIFSLSDAFDPALERLRVQLNQLIAEAIALQGPELRIRLADSFAELFSENAGIFEGFDPGASIEDMIVGLKDLIATLKAAGADVSELQRILEYAFIVQAREEQEAVEDLTEARRREAEALMRSIEDLEARGLALVGRSNSAELAALRARQRREEADVEEALRPLLAFIHQLEEMQLRTEIAARMEAEVVEEAAERQIAGIQDLIELQSAQLRIAEDALSEQETTVERLRDVLDTLNEFNAGLLLSDLSPLSPTARLTEARNQFRDLLALAQGGDLAAAGQLPALARALLEASRDVNASGVGFVSDFRFVQEALRALADQTAGQLTIEERTLNEMVAQTEAIRTEIERLEELKLQVAADAEAQIAAIHEAADAQGRIFSAELDRLLRETREGNRTTDERIREVTTTVDTNNRITRDAAVDTVDRLDRIDRSIRENTEMVRRSTTTATRV